MDLDADERERGGEERIRYKEKSKTMRYVSEVEDTKRKEEGKKKKEKKKEGKKIGKKKMNYLHF
jgi:hypothetical protein